MNKYCSHCMCKIEENEIRCPECGSLLEKNIPVHAPVEQYTR